MDIISLIIVLVVLGAVFSLAWYYLVPLIQPPPIQNAVRILVVLLAILVLLSLIGIVPSPFVIRIGR